MRVVQKHQEVCNRTAQQIAQKILNWHTEGVDYVVRNNEVWFRELDTEDWYRIKVTHIIGDPLV